MTAGTLARAGVFDGFGPRLAQFALRRLIEFSGVAIAVLGVALALALASYDIQDPSLLHATDRPPANLLGLGGSMLADPLLRGLGATAAVLPVALLIWGIRIMLHHPPLRLLVSASVLVPAIGALAAFLAAYTPPEAWVLDHGLGGVVGDLFLVRILGAAPDLASVSEQALEVAILCALALIGTILALGSFGVTVRVIVRISLFPLHLTYALLHEIGHLVWNRLKQLSRLRIAPPRLPRLPRLALPALRIPAVSWVALNPFAKRVAAEPRPAPDPVQAPAAHPREPLVALPGGALSGVPAKVSAAAKPQTAPRRAPAPAPSRARRQPARRSKPAPAPLLAADGIYVPPALDLLRNATVSRRPPVSARMVDELSDSLQSVLAEYGIGGSIVGARTGPAVTLFELDPPPGLRASKIENLADDIARSMGVVSARISTVPGSTTIGIEIPNHQRQHVMLREILDTRDYADTRVFLPLALGKDIQGEPVVVDLEKMPHLLIAGTTGSGKSVSVNAMILSLLFRHSPEDCRMILIDPKMLEFSAYDDIPHLLTPVVTDPKTAVAALKWVVREMEERYRLMSQVGVRNITSFNAKAATALRKGAPLTRKIQSGFDPDTRQPVYEEVEIAVEHLPRIVVVVDEMADLMMVAGKEIEACVQRLAQMARASGIHLIMATQRPSVDVITGTIKANFPTRISFNVSSKIDSRTILNQQGAEKLLGAGDMLYLASGARLSRIHGPFVSDEEIEQIVAHLKALGPPEYVPDVIAVEETDAGFGGGADGADDLYIRALEIIRNDQKASTSYLQRKLEIGYNRAARLMDQMEKAGVVGAPNNAGKREILIS